MKTFIRVRLQIEGLHCWKDCPLEDVSFLKDQHRHIFHIECTKEVSHNDRDIEIIRFKRLILKYLKDTYGNIICEFGSQSCEMIATELLEKFDLTSCEVMEDRENGSIVFNY